MNLTPLKGWAQALLEGGLSNREVVRVTGLNPATVRRIRSDLHIWGVPTKCACGLDGGHRGWCSHRYRNSFARQRFIAKWHDGTLAHCKPDPFVNLFCREQTYRKPEDARRSFYKYVCKHEFYGVMEGPFTDEFGTFYSRRQAKYTFGAFYPRGYPAWEASRSEVRDRWNQEFLTRKEEIVNAGYDEGERRKAAVERVNMITDKTTRFFRLASVTGALAK